jgi:hypothetical protein
MTEARNRKPVYVMGVDPGTTTGLALLALDVEDTGRPMAVSGAQLSWQEAAEWVEKTLSKMRLALDGGRAIRCVAVCELYAINANTAMRGQAGANDAMGMAGVLRRNCELTGVEMAPLQQASAAKSLVKDDGLRSMGLYAPGLGHVNDAYRHAVLLALKLKLMNPRWLLGDRA